MASVVLTVPLQKYVYGQTANTTTLLILWAAIEELMKFFAFFVIAARNHYLDEPVDYAVDMITVALGFAAMENALFLVNPLENDSVLAALITGNLRFVGASVLHITASAFIGLFMGLAFFGGSLKRFTYLIFGLVTAILLHALFNLFIITYKDQNIFVIFGFLWVVTVIVMLLFEKVKHLR